MLCHLEVVLDGRQRVRGRCFQLRVGAALAFLLKQVDRALMRLTLNAKLTDQDIERLLSVLAEIRDEVQLDTWSSTRRALRDNATAQKDLVLNNIRNRAREAAAQA